MGWNFDADYLDFVRANNGGTPETNIFSISSKNESGINQFISFDRLPYEAALISDQVGPKIVPIAYAEGGNYLCLSIDDGGIYFFDHELPGLDALTKIASSLREFLDEVKPFDPKQVALKPGQVKKAWINPAFLKK